MITLVSCDRCNLGYPAPDVRRVTRTDGSTPTLCRECADREPEAVFVDPYCTPVLPGQMGLLEVRE